ncbi:MAG: DUF1249 domain-containing protein [Granulosicoccus sp.]|nr:DUF1249 domain-containing protein [Granulosicoccus sp.]
MYSTVLNKPRTSGRFANLMDLYEQNYLLMRLLAPELRAMDGGDFVSHAPGAMPLELREVNHSRYTTSFKLTYRFSDSSRHRKTLEPDLDIRLYHDARVCEVMSGLLSEGRLEIRRTRDLEEGRRLNRFLNKWLSYCLRQGHGFSLDQSEQQIPRLETYCVQC